MKNVAKIPATIIPFFISFIFFPVGMYGCKGGSEVNYQQFSENAFKVKVGMSKSEVMELVGKPQRESDAQWVYHHTAPAPLPGGRNIEGLEVTFEKDTAIKVRPLFVSGMGPVLQKQDAARTISKGKAAQLANDYLKSINVDWGKPVSIEIVEQSSAILVDGKQAQWNSCYYVQYETPEWERKLEGLRTVVVTRDGLKTALPISR